MALTVLARALSFFSVLLFARAMSPADFGVYGFLQASANLTVVFTTFNLPTPISVILARGGGHRLRLENTILTAVLLGSMMLGALTSLLGFFFAFPSISIGLNGVMWFLVFTSMSSLQLLSGAALVARGERLRSAVGILAGSVALCITLALVQSLSLAQALRLGALSVAFGGIISGAMLLSGGLHKDFRHVGSSLVSFLKRSGKTIFLFSVLSFCTSLAFQSGLWLLQRQLLAHGGAVEGAVFALGNQFYNVVLFLPGIFAPLLLRRLSIVRVEREQIGELLRAGGAAICVAALGTVIFAEVGPFILLMLPEKYRVGPEPLTLAVAAGAIMLAKAPFSVFFQARVSASAEFFASLAATAILVLGAFVPAVVMDAVGSLWLRVFAHFVLFAVVFGVFVARWRFSSTKLS
ncbi:lipopolysaccharide biosynthesis protein [Bradyrhizobium zhanjiangense]|nr:hypothetical protein [Bradyrhizobium zhanjiangense]